MKAQQPAKENLDGVVESIIARARESISAQSKEVRHG